MSRSRTAVVVGVALLAALAGCTAGVSPADTTAAAEPDPLERGVTVTVTEVTDGDTMDVRFPDGRTETVRLLGVDTPEVTAATTPDEWETVPDTDAGASWLRTWGTRASEFATDELAGATVEIRTDPTADRRGGYGRLLVYLSRPGQDRSFNRQLLTRGYARLYESAFARRDEFAAAEARAREAGTGVWGFETERQATGDKSTPLALVRVHADAAGNDHENLDDEYLVFENRRNESIDLSGWRIVDGAGHTYTVPDGVELAPGARLTVVTGAGTDTETTVFWGATSAVWNNDGDTVIVRTASGETVLRTSY